MTLRSIIHRFARGKTINKVVDALSGPAALEKMLVECGYSGRPEGLSARLEMELPLTLPLFTDSHQRRHWATYYKGPEMVASAKAGCAFYPPRPQAGEVLPASVVKQSKKDWILQRPWNSGHLTASLARAWLVTGDKDFLSGVERQFREFHLFSPPLMGPGWHSGALTAIRSVNWILALRLVENISRMEPAVTAQAVLDLRVAGMVLSTELEAQIEPGLDFLGHACALMFLGRCLSILPESGGWLKQGASAAGPCLAAWARADITRPTAMAAAYCQWAVLALWLAGKAGCDTPGLEDALPPVAAFCRTAAPPWGGAVSWGFSSLWPVLDLDGACSLAEAHAWPANMAAILLRDSELRADRQMYEPLYWLCGPETPSKLRNLANLKGPEAMDAPCLGNTNLCSNSANRRVQLSLRSSPRNKQAPDQRQAEALSFGLMIDGSPIVISSGVIPGGPMESLIKVRRANNGPVIDGAESRDGSVILEGLEQTTNHAFVSATYDGYKHLADPVALRRRLHIDAARGVLNIVDQMDSRQSHTMEINLLLAAEADTQQADEGLWAVCGAFGIVLVRPEPKAQCELVRGRSDPALGWVATAAGEVVPASVLRIYCRVMGQASMTTSIVWGQG